MQRYDSVIIGIVLFKEFFTLPKVLFVTLLLIGIICLKIASIH